MRIDWHNLPEGRFTLPSLDWSDPTHVPLMVWDTIESLGNLAECCCLDEDGDVNEFGRELEVIALDAMPQGEHAIRSALEFHIRQTAIVEDWTDWIYEPNTTRYPWEDEEDRPLRKGENK